MRLAKEVGSDALFVQTDVTKAVEVQALIEKTLETYGRLDCAFNNAGSGKANSIIEMSEQDWDFDIAVNLKRVGEAEDVAQAVVWLCSDAASFITGQNLVIDGGYTVQS